MIRSNPAKALVLALFCGALLLFFPRVLFAQDEAGARVLFAQARKLAAGGNYAEACPKFEDSYRLDPGIGTSFNLADCWEHLGRTASAWGRFLDVAAATKGAGQPERERVARARAAALEPRLARLAIQVMSPVTGLVVLRDDVRVDAPSWGLPIPVDPGRHKLEATAAGKRRWTAQVEVPDLPTTASVVVPALDDAPALAARPTGPGTNANGAAAKSPDSTLVAHRDERRRWSRPVVVLGAIAGVALATGGAFGVKFEIDNDDAKSICPTNMNCSAQVRSDHATLVNQVHDDLTIELVSIGVGGTALLAAGYLWWRDRRHPAPHAEALSIAPFELGVAGIALRGTW